MAEDPLEKESLKQKKKRLEREAKDRKARAKLEKRYAKEAAKLGISVDEYTEIMEEETGARRAKKKKAPTGTTKATGAPAKAKPKAGEVPEPPGEGREFELVDPWSRQSTEPLDDIERRIDRMSGTAVKSLKDRYREKYGEDLSIPDLYQAQIDDLEGGGGSSLYEAAPARETAAQGREQGEAPKTEEPRKKRKLFGGFGRKRKKGMEEDEDDEGDDFEDDRVLYIWSYSESFWHLRRWWPDTRESGWGGKILGGFGGILVYIFLFIPRIFTTPFVMLKKRRERKLLSAE